MQTADGALTTSSLNPLPEEVTMYGLLMLMLIAAADIIGLLAIVLITVDALIH